MTDRRGGTTGTRKFKVGDKVRVWNYAGEAKIDSFMDDIDGGVKLDTPIGGFRFWNVLDLELIEAAPKKKEKKN